MKRSIKEIGIRIVILFIGLTIAHLGVTLFLLANLITTPDFFVIEYKNHVLSGYLINVVIGSLRFLSIRT